MQVRLFDFLIADFFSNANLMNILRRTHTVISLMHTLKKYYWIVPPQTPYASHRERTDQRMDRLVVVHIRSCILQMVDRLMFTFTSDAEEKDFNRDDEFQCLLNFICTVQEVSKEDSLKNEIFAYLLSIFLC